MTDTELRSLTVTLAASIAEREAELAVDLARLQERGRRLRRASDALAEARRLLDLDPA